MSTLRASLTMSVLAELISSLDVGAAKYAPEQNIAYTLEDGTGADQAKEMFTDRRTINASSNDDLDLSGVLANAFGASLVFTKIKALIIKAAAGNTNDVVVGGAASAQVASIFGAVTHTIKVKPGGMLALVASDVNGYTIAAGTADILRIANGGSGTPVTYDITIIGVV